MVRPDQFWSAKTGPGMPKVMVWEDHFWLPKLVWGGTTFGKGGPLLAAKSGLGGPVLAAKSGPGGPLLGGTTFGMTGPQGSVAKILHKSNPSIKILAR